MTQYEYDERHLLWRSTHGPSSPQKVTYVRDYDVNANLTSLAYGSRKTVMFTYDLLDDDYTENPDGTTSPKPGKTGRIMGDVSDDDRTLLAVVRTLGAR